MRISSNLASLTAQRASSRTERETAQALQQLASGTKFNSPGADPAGLAIAQGLKAQTKGYQAALANTENAGSFIQIAEGALAEQNNILIRLRELAVQSASDTLSDVERGYLNDEATQLTDEFDRIARSTKYGSQPLLDGSSRDYEFQVGVHSGEENIVRYTNDTNTTASNVGINGLSVADKSDARDALSSLDEAIVTMGAARAKLGAIQSRLDSTVSHLQSQVEGLSEAESRMSDTDIPQAVTTIRRGQILAQYQAMALQAANESMGTYLRLIA